MQQYPGGRAPRPVRAPRTQPMLPGTSPSIAPTLAPTINKESPAINRGATTPSNKRPDHVRRATLKLLALGALLEGLYLALYPLLASTITKNAAARQAMLGLFHWLPHLYWTTWLPFLTRALAHIPALDPSKGGIANLLGLLLACAFVLALLAARVGNRVIKERLSATQTRIIFLMILLLTGIFGLTFLCAPGMMSQDLFLYGLKSRMILVYHVNPYLVAQEAFPQDVLYTALLKGVQDVTVYGPVWIDLSILVALPAGASVANIMIGFRLLGLIAHLLNALLIWTILAKLKPEARITGTLLYAWNPLVLLMSVAEMHQTVVVVLFVLLAVFLFQRKSLMLSWAFLLLAALINFWYLLLLPLFLLLLGKEARAMRRGEGFLWWLGLICVSALVIVLAYTPYWQGWGAVGVIDSLRESFIPNSAVNSLDAALLALPLRFPAPVSWLISPQHWIILAAATVAGLLLFGLWLADTLKLALLLNSWLFLALLVFFPSYWPWYVLPPLALAICSTGVGTTLLAVLLAMGAALSYYYWLWQPAWPGQGLVTVGLPLLLWGWTLFFTSTWQMAHANDTEPAARKTKRLSRPSWISRPSWPGRPSWPSRKR